MPADRSIDYVELPASDLDAAQSFYQTVFGWSFTDYGPDYRAFNDGRLDGGFYRSELRSSTRMGAALLVLYSTDIDRTREIVLVNGGQISKETFAFPGGFRFHFTDPNGNELAVWSERRGPVPQ